MAKKNQPAADAASSPDATEHAPPILAPGGQQFHAIREVIESVAVAFVLAFMFRTFVAEAFVIPTGSMSPALQGAHKDVDCDQCGFRFRVTASNENPEDLPPRYARNPQLAQTVGGMCPMCRRLMPFRADLPPAVLEAAATPEPEFQPTYPGDRIVVSKFGLDYADPERWDVVVFKFPGDGNMNYIKRLTGLPGDKLRVYQGDLFIQSPGDEEFAIARRPVDTIAAMLQPVHDTDYEPSVLHRAGWPLRWAATTADGWKHAADDKGENVTQSFTIDAKKDAADEIAWIRYRHLVPNEDVWRVVLDAKGRELNGDEKEALAAAQRPELISDFNPYNARIQRDIATDWGWEVMPPRRPVFSGSTGYEWVGDLAVEAQVEVKSAGGEIVLDLVEAGYHCRATIAVDSGKVECSIVDGRTDRPVDFQATGKCAIKGPGAYDVRLANVDDRLLLWVDGQEAALDGAAWDPEKLLGGRKKLIPWASEDEQADQGDLSPAGVGSRGASLAVNRLQVWRDIYYIAARHDRDLRQRDDNLADYPPLGIALQLDDGTRVPQAASVPDLLAAPETWSRFVLRRTVEFAIDKDQYFVMGDNSPESLDARLWTDPSGRGVPGGHYVDRRLLIGKALAVFWPHSWGSIPGLRMLPGFPNFGDMRLVR